MKPFRLYLGQRGTLLTYEVTDDPAYKIVVATVNEIRHRLITNSVLRQPIRHIFNTIYQEESKSQERSRDATPGAADQASNKKQKPSDGDVLDFLVNGFPDLYLRFGSISLDNVRWGDSSAGAELSEKEDVTMNIRLVQLWLRSISSDTKLGGVDLSFLFITLFFHQLAQCSLVWYSKGSRDNLNLGGSEEDAGDYYEKTVFGGISACEMDKESLEITQIGICKGSDFYPIHQEQVDELLYVDTSGGLPLTDISALSPAPAPAASKFLSKMSVDQCLKPQWVPAPMGMEKTFYTTLKGDKKRVLNKTKV